MYDKNEEFVNEIEPLIKQIIKLCEEKGIPHAMTFLVADMPENYVYYAAVGYTPEDEEPDMYPDIEMKHFKKLEDLIYKM